MQSFASLVLVGCAAAALLILVVFALRKARGQNLHGHVEGCGCPLCAKAKA